MLFVQDGSCLDFSHRARLEGLGRKGDGEAGWQSLWRGWQELQLLLQGAQLAQELQAECG